MRLEIKKDNNDINRGAAKISALLSGKIDNYEYQNKLNLEKYQNKLNLLILLLVKLLKNKQKRKESFYRKEKIFKNIWNERLDIIEKII